jgi:hypothetical protein
MGMVEEGLTSDSKVLIDQTKTRRLVLHSCPRPHLISSTTVRYQLFNQPTRSSPNWLWTPTLQDQADGASPSVSVTKARWRTSLRVRRSFNATFLPLSRCSHRRQSHDQRTSSPPSSSMRQETTSQQVTRGVVSSFSNAMNRCVDGQITPFICVVLSECPFTSPSSCSLPSD